jgi:hypothetical protein
MSRTIAPWEFTVRHFARVGRDGGLGDLIADIAAMAPLLALERRQRPSRIQPAPKPRTRPHGAPGGFRRVPPLAPASGPRSATAGCTD